MLYCLETKDEKLAIQMQNFASQIGVYANIFDLNGTEIASIKADAAYFSWAVNNLEKINAYTKNWLGFKTILLESESELTTNTMPVPPALDSPPAMVPVGVQKHFSSVVNYIREHPAYTRDIGQNLGIETMTPRAQCDKPVLRLSVRAGRVQVKWTKDRFAGILIEKDSGMGFVLLDKDFIADYTDPTPLPEGILDIWRYRAIYLQGDDKVGRWSDISGITVGGW